MKQGIFLAMIVVVTLSAAYRIVGVPAAPIDAVEPAYHYGDRVEIVKGFYRKVGYPASVVGYDRGLYTVQLGVYIPDSST